MTSELGVTNGYLMPSNGDHVACNNQCLDTGKDSNVTVNNQLRHLEPRPFRPFKSSEEYLYAMKEDLAEWLNALYNLNIIVDNFMEKLETGVILCRHANNIIRKARSNSTVNITNNTNGNGLIPIEKELLYRVDVTPGTFHARDNVSNFISWCRKLGIMECLLFETDDLVLRKNEKSFILCLLEIARQGSKIGMIAPMLVQLEQEIDREIAQDEVNNKTSVTTSDPGTLETKKCPSTNTRSSVEDNKENLKEVQSMKNLHEMVVDILNICSCPSKFPMIKVADGKYRIGDTKVLIFVRILRNHVMVRVGGGWDTLGHYLDRHDPCRCRAGHRFSTSAKLTFTEGGDPSSGPQMVVTYNRPEEPVTNSIGQVNGDNINGSTVNGTVGGNLVNGGRASSMTNYSSPNHHLKRRNSGPLTGDYLNLIATSSSTSQSINNIRRDSHSVGFNNSNANLVSNGKCSNLVNSQSKRDHQGSNTVNYNTSGTPRLPSSTSTSSTLSSSSSSSSTGYPDVLIIDRQESRASHYSDDSTDTSSVIMESPSPTQQLEPQSDDSEQQQQQQQQQQPKQQQTSSSSPIKSNCKTKSESKINKSNTISVTPSGTSKGTYHDSSSSEFSESEINHSSAIGLSGGSRRRCSPRKIMKTSDLLGTEKPSWASDDFVLCDKETSVNKPDEIETRLDGRLSGQPSPFQRNCRYRRSEQKVSTRLADDLNGKESVKCSDGKNKCRSSEDLSQVGPSDGKNVMTWKNPIRPRAASSSISSSPNRKVTSPKRGISEVKEPPMSCFERGRNYYASLPRSRSSSQSSRAPLSDFSTPTSKTSTGHFSKTTTCTSSPFARGSPGRYSLNTHRGSLTESISLGSCRSDRFGYGTPVNGKLSRQNSENGEAIRTWAFKSRTRAALDPDLFKPCESSRTSFRYGQHSTPGQRSRSSDSSPSRVALNSALVKVNGNQMIAKRPVKLISQFDSHIKSSLGDNNNNMHHGKDINDNNNNSDGDQFSLQNDILKNMENIVNQYQTRVERALPCKINSSESINLEADCDGKSNDPVINCSYQKCNLSKIPMPIRSTPRKES